jgi:5-methylcytosine-specific restriction endonuclease McrA
VNKRTIFRLWSLLMQNGRCLLCGEAIFIEQDPHSYGGPTIEHKVPVNRGGAAWRQNQALSHHECNRWRGDRLLLKCSRPPQDGPRARENRRGLVPVSGIWYSHFRLPVEDRRWEQRRTP